MRKENEIWIYLFAQSLIKSKTNLSDFILDFINIHSQTLSHPLVTNLK